MSWLLTGHGSLCLEEHSHQAYRWMKLSLFTFSTQVRTFIWIASEIENAEQLDYSKPDSNEVNPDVSPEKGIPRLEHKHFVELERKLSAILAAQSDRDRRIAQLTDELAQKSALLKQAEANAAEAQKRAGLELRELQAKLDELVLSRDHALEQAQSACALQKATSCVAESNERSQRELARVRAELEARKSELAAVHLRLKDAESGWAKSKAEANTSRAKTEANLVNTDEDEVIRRLTERVRAMEAEIAS